MTRITRYGLAVASVVAVIVAMAAPLSRPAQAATIPTPTAATGCTLFNGAIGLNALSPTPGEVITGSSLPLQVNAVGYRLDARYAGTPNLAGIGHYHEILDGNLVDMTPTRDANRDTVSMVGVTPGSHVLTLVPACNDHSMVMAAAVSIPFTYAGPYLPLPNPVYFANPPSISIVSPANGATVQGLTFSMTVNVSNFALCGDCFGKAAVDGVGHWHIFVDAPMMANMLTMASTSTQDVYLKGVTPGWHTFYALLVDNHHMPLMNDPSGLASVRVFVQPAS